jgi:hypothetical protein
MAADFEPHQAALTAWAYANAGHPAPELFDALAERQLPNKATADYDSLAIWVWAYATAQHPSPKLFAAVASRPWLFATGGAVFRKTLWLLKKLRLPLLGDWLATRDLPAAPAASFRSQWRARK